MIEWKDVSSYSRTDTVREPRGFEIQFGETRITVHRHIDFPPDQWLLTCYTGDIRGAVLANKDVAKAKKEALKLMNEWFALRRAEVKAMIQSTRGKK